VGLAGCSSEGEPSAGESTSADAREATTAPPPPPAAPKSLSEWRGGYSVWLDEVGADLREIGLAIHDRNALRLMREDGIEAYREGALDQYFESLRDCARLEATLTPAPKRAEATLDLLRRSCEPLARGGELVAAGIEEDDGALFREALAKWRTAVNLVEDGNEELAMPERVEALPLPVEDGQTEISRVEPLLTRATRLMNKGGRFAARCWSVEDWERIEREEFGKKVDLAGFATERYANLNLAPRMCESLALLAYSDERPTGVAQLDAAFAVVVLMHETAHLAEGDRFFTREEALAECWAMQFVRPAARSLGVEAAYADELAERYWEEVYPLVERKYRSPECKNGGKLDARPGTDVFP